MQKCLQSSEGDADRKMQLGYVSLAKFWYSCEALKMRFVYRNAKMTQFRSQCKLFFMELVSSLCFGQATPPEPELVKHLLNIVFVEKEDKLQTKDFTYSKHVKKDRVPVIRSFLLQLLLEYKWAQHKYSCIFFNSLYIMLIFFSQFWPSQVASWWLLEMFQTSSSKAWSGSLSLVHSVSGSMYFMKNACPTCLSLYGFKCRMLCSRNGVRNQC